MTRMTRISALPGSGKPVAPVPNTAMTATNDPVGPRFTGSSRNVFPNNQPMVRTSAVPTRACLHTAVAPYACALMPLMSRLRSDVTDATPAL